MENKKILKDSYLWRPCNAAWQQLSDKHERDRRPINQILNDIVIDYFTPKLFDNVQQSYQNDNKIKPARKGKTTPKKAKRAKVKQS